LWKKFYSNWESNYPTDASNITNDRCGVLRGGRGFDSKWYDAYCGAGSTKKNLKFICQKEATEQDACTQYYNPTTESGGHCVHTDQCPGNFFVDGLCSGYNDADIKCCLNTNRREFFYFIMFSSNQILKKRDSFYWVRHKE
jgi:hypothetical protein